MSNAERILVAAMVLTAVVIGLALCSYSLSATFAKSADRIERAAR